MSDKWSDALCEFDIHLRAAGRARGTRSLRRRQLSQLGDASGVGPRRVTHDHVLTWLAQDWKPTTRSSARAAVTTFFGWMHSTGRRSDNPALHLPAVHVPPGRPRPCSESALATAFIAARPRERLMLELAACAGLRRAEVAAVRGDDVEDALGGCVLRVMGKGARERAVPISDALAERIRSYGPGYLFPGVNGHMHPTYVGALISDLLPPGVTAHTLRHRFASTAYSADRDIRAVQELLGHSSVATTQTYTAVSDASRRRAVSAAAVA